MIENTNNPDKLEKSLKSLVAVLDDHNLSSREAINVGLIFFGKLIGICLSPEHDIEDFIQKAVINNLKYHAEFSRRSLKDEDFLPINDEQDKE